MTLWYNATHSVSFIRTINGSEVRKNSWSDWHAVPSSRPHPEPPEVKTKYIDIPGAHGQIDMTEATTGGVRYNNVKGSIELILRNSYPNDKLWNEVYNDILEFLHGKVCKIVFEDLVDEKTLIGWYWEGRTTVSSITSEKMYTKIKIDYNAYPFPVTRNCANDPAIEIPGEESESISMPINGMGIIISEGPVIYYGMTMNSMITGPLR